MFIKNPCQIFIKGTFFPTTHSLMDPAGTLLDISQPQVDQCPDASIFAPVYTTDLLVELISIVGDLPITLADFFSNPVS